MKISNESIDDCVNSILTTIQYFPQNSAHSQKHEKRAAIKEEI